MGRKPPIRKREGRPGWPDLSKKVVYEEGSWRAGKDSVTQALAGLRKQPGGGQVQGVPTILHSTFVRV